MQIPEPNFFFKLSHKRFSQKILGNIRFFHFYYCSSNFWLVTYWNIFYGFYRNQHCTYLGYVLLEAPREYVLHGPLLSIYWLRLCPHLGGPRPKPRHPERLFIVLMTAAHISPNVFPRREFIGNILGLFLCFIIISFILIIHHIHTHIYIFYFTCL
jgi:hypothetical protein